MTSLTKHVPEKHLKAFQEVPAIQRYMKSPEQGAATTVWTAVGKVWEGKGRVYLEDCQESSPVKEGYTILSPGYEKYAFDREKEGRLWRESLKMVGLKDSD